MNVQYSVFSNNRIDPTPDIVNTMLTELNSMDKFSFIPNLITGQNIDLLAGKMNPVNNISFTTVDQLVQIACMNERIDVVLNGTEKNQDFTVEERILYARSVLYMIMKKYHIFSNRLALNISLLSNPIEGSVQETPLGKKLCSTLDFYSDNSLEEWSSRVNARKSIKIENDELLNIITELSLFVDGSGKKRFLCHMDINTIFENSGYRFSFESLERFDCEVKKIVNEIAHNFEEVNNG